jgi:hypothetical protein
MEKIELDAVDYKIRQSREDLQYAAEYRAWIQSLPEDERQQLASLGLDRPSTPGYSSGTGINGDVGEDAVAEEPVTPDPDADHDWRVAADLRAAEVVAKLISELLATDPTLGAECLALATGVAYQGASENAIARKYGVSRAAVSKRCIELSEKLGVKNVRAMKSETAREIYADRAVEAHRAAGREITGEPSKAKRVETMGALASRAAAVWRRVKKSQWIKDAGTAELLLARRSLRPCFQIADELAAMIRKQDDPAILAELDRDLAGQA